MYIRSMRDGEPPTVKAYIFKSRLVQKLDILASKSGLLDFIHVSFLLLFRPFSNGGRAGLSHQS